MKKNIVGIIIIVSMFSAASARSLPKQPEWEKYFSDRNAIGTIYLVEERWSVA